MSSPTAVAVHADSLPSVQDITLTPANFKDAEEWDEFVRLHPEGRFCHLWGYKQVLEETFGYRCVYWNIFSRGKRVGVFPSIVARRGRLISQPFNEYGGPLTQGLSDSQFQALPKRLMQAAAEKGCHAIEIRGGVGCEAMAQSEFCHKHPLHCYGTLQLAPKETLWRKSLSHEARKDIARAEREGVEGEIRRGMEAVSGDFYRLYLLSMKRLGVPPHSYRFFAKLGEAFGECLVAAWATVKGSAVAILLGAITGERLHVFVTASDSRAWRLRPNDLAHWRLIEWAVARGLKTFDFGSARYPGQIQFKKKWGVALREYSYYSIAAPGSAAASRIQSVETGSRSMVMLSRVWQTLVPVSFSRVLGPPIRRYLTK